MSSKLLGFTDAFALAKTLVCASRHNDVWRFVERSVNRDVSPSVHYGAALAREASADQPQSRGTWPVSVGSAAEGGQFVLHRRGLQFLKPQLQLIEKSRRALQA